MILLSAGVYIRNEFYYTLVPYFCFKLNERTAVKINQKAKNVWKIEFHQLSTFITTTHGSVWWRYDEMVRCVLSSVTPPDLLYILQIYIYCVIMLHFFCHQSITPPFCRWQNYCVTCLVELFFGSFKVSYLLQTYSLHSYFSRCTVPSK